jgi:hypothetical protein
MHIWITEILLATVIIVITDIINTQHYCDGFRLKWILSHIWTIYKYRVNEIIFFNEISLILRFI